MRLDFGIPYDLPDPRRTREPDPRPREAPSQAPSISYSQPTPLELRREVLRARAAENRMPNIPRPSRQRVPKHQPPEPQRELFLERSRDIERRIGRDRLPPRYLGLQIRPEEMKLLTELGCFRVITARDLTETVYENQKGRFTHDLQFLKDENLVATDYVNARRDGRLQKVEHIEVVTHQDGTGLGPRQW